MCLGQNSNITAIGLRSLLGSPAGHLSHSVFTVMRNVLLHECGKGAQNGHGTLKILDAPFFTRCIWRLPRKEWQSNRRMLWSMGLAADRSIVPGPSGTAWISARSYREPGRYLGNADQACMLDVFAADAMAP